MGHQKPKFFRHFYGLPSKKLKDTKKGPKDNNDLEVWQLTIVILIPVWEVLHSVAKSLKISIRFIFVERSEKPNFLVKWQIKSFS